MRIHIKTADNWILKEFADNWAKRISGCTVSTEVDRTADINFFVNYALYEEVLTKTVSYFTHREKDEERGRLFDDIAKKSDVCISMCDITKGKVDRVTSKPSYIVKPGINEAYRDRPIQMGVVARRYDSGRKRLEFADRLEGIEGVQVNYAGGNYEAFDMPDFYKKQDYILVTADNEGGPMPVLEALAMRKPLIVPKDVGWCNDYPAIRYETYKELEEIVRKLRFDFSMYDRSVEQLLDIFKNEFNYT